MYVNIMALAFMGGASLLAYLYDEKQKEKQKKLRTIAPRIPQNFQNPQNLPRQQVRVETFQNDMPMQQAPQMIEEPMVEMPKVGPMMNRGSNLLETYDNFIPANDPTSQYLVDIPKRPIQDFSHNNMVPFFRGEAKQNMAGTGVQSGNYIDGISVDSGFDESTPNQTKLASFTGIDDTYLNKREAGPMFSPAEQQTGWVYGQPLFREDISQYTQTLNKRNDLAPTEKIMVGPGLALDPTIPAEGGFHQFTRVMPNNPNDYKANQLENRVNMGKLFSAGLPTAYPGVGVSGALTGEKNKNGARRGPGVPKHRPPKDISQVRYPTMSNKIGFVSSVEMIRSDWDVDKRPSNSVRDQDSYGYGELNNVNGESKQRSFKRAGNDGSEGGPCVSYANFVGIAPATYIPVTGQRSATFMSMDNNIRSLSDCNSQPIGNPHRSGQMPGPLLTNYYVNETDRGQLAPNNVEQLNIKGPNVYNNTSFLDHQKVTNKETTDVNYQGNPERQSQAPTFYTYEDNPKNTTRSTTEYSYSGNPNGSNIQFNEESRYQYTGPEQTAEVQNGIEKFSSIDYNKLSQKKVSASNKQMGGARTFTIRGSTLIQDYVPTPGRSNIVLDAQDRMGKINMGTFGMDDLIQNGPGSLLQALPSAAYQQNNYIMAVPNPSPNKLIGIDDRQLATYQVNTLQSNPLSIFTTNPDADVPSFFKDNEPDDFSDLIVERDESIKEILDKQEKDPNFNVENVYPPGNNFTEQDNENPNVKLLDGSNYFGEYNPLISQGSSRDVNNNPDFNGLGYSGKFSKDGKNPNDKGQLGVEVYGGNGHRERDFLDFGFTNHSTLETCEPNRALSFENTLILNEVK